MLYDLIIIGGGAGGTAAAIYAARRGLKFKLIVNIWGGEVARSGEIANYPGFIQTDGAKLAQKFKDQLQANQVEIEEGVKVKQIIDQKTYLKLHTSSGKYQTRTILVATGSHPQKLNIPGEKRLKGKGVSYCTTCDGPLFKNKEVAIIGGGNSALEAGLMMAGIASKVFLITIDSAFTGEAALIRNLKDKKNIATLFETETKEILGEENVMGISIQNLKTHRSQILKVQGIFVHIGVAPNSQLVNVKKNQFGEIMVNQVGQTSHPRIWAVGDVTNHPYKQIAIAAGQGISAVLNIVEFLNKNGNNRRQN